MSGRLTRLVAGIALTTMVLVSAIGVCKQIVMACGWSCSQHSMDSMMSEMAADCVQDATTCLAATGDHLATFASQYPAVAVNTLLLAFGAVYVAVAFWRSINDQPSYERMRSRMRSLKFQLLKSIAPDFLVLAFRRGILNAKVYASS